MPPGQGYDSWVSFKKETTFGTDPTGTRDFYLRVVRDTMKPNRNYQQYPGMAGPGVRSRFPGNIVVAGEIEPEFHYEGLGKLLYWALGTNSYTYSVDTPVAGANTHEIKAASDQALPSFSMELVRGDTPTGKCFLYEGCMIDQLVFEWANQALVKFAMSLVAMKETPDSTPDSTTPTFPSDHPVLWHNVGQVTIAVVSSIDMKSGRLAVNNNLQKDRFLMSQYISQPLRANNRVIDGSCVAEFDSVSEYTAFNGDVDSTFSLAFTSEEMVTGSTPYSYTFAASKSQFNAVESNVESPGPIDLPLSFHINGSNEELTATIINAATTYA